MYLLDTNVVSELRRVRPHGGVLAWAESVADADLHLSAVTIGEIQAGIEITREQDPEKAAEIEAWLDQVADTYNILPMDAPNARLCVKGGQSDNSNWRCQIYSRGRHASGNV
jgi:toxin FitB